MPVNGQQKADQMVLRISCRASFGFFLTSDAQNDLLSNIGWSSCIQLYMFDCNQILPSFGKWPIA